MQKNKKKNKSGSKQLFNKIMNCPQQWVQFHHFNHLDGLFCIDKIRTLTGTDKIPAETISKVMEHTITMLL